MAAEVTYNGRVYNARHGGPFDRGSADSWYSRGLDHHYYQRDSYTSPRVELAELTPAEIAEYEAGYYWNERHGGKKDYS
jgi:hypothetical protein